MIQNPINHFGMLKTGRLLIRNLETGDADALYAYKSRPEAVQFQSWRPQSLCEVQGFILGQQGVELNTSGAWLQLAVCLHESGEMIGDIGLHFSAEDETQVELGYTVSPHHQRKGYATEALGAVVAYLFQTLGKRRITASVDPRNGPSAAVLLRLGFRLEAYFVKSYWMDGEWQDDCAYGLLKDEWK